MDYYLYSIGSWYKGYSSVSCNQKIGLILTWFFSSIWVIYEFTKVGPDLSYNLSTHYVIWLVPDWTCPVYGLTCLPLCVNLLVSVFTCPDLFLIWLNYSLLDLFFTDLFVPDIIWFFVELIWLFPNLNYVGLNLAYFSLTWFFVN